MSSKNNNHFFVFKYFIISTIFLGISFFIYNCQKPLVPTPSLHHYYDYIIVGGGTAGCVLSALLSKSDKFNVLLIEAGDEFNILSKIPLTPTLIQRGSNDWSFETIPQKYSSFGLQDKRQFLPRGKGLGGSGQINYFLHDVGLPSDYDKWVKLGATNWNYSTIKPYFDRIFISPNSSDNLTNKDDPVIRLTNIDHTLENLTTAFKEASKYLKNFKINVSSFLNTIYNGRRESSFEKYLLPVIERKNLHILTNTLVSKIHFVRKRAYSVEAILPNNKTRKIIAAKEIIISCGSIKTPQLLMLSGIGPEEHLKNHHIEIIAKSEYVGKNLHDHLNMPIYVSIEKPISVTLNKIFTISSILEYLWFGTGFISSSAVAAIGLGENNTSLIMFALGSTDETLLRQIANTNVNTFRTFFPLHHNKSQEGFVFLANCLQPTSRGNVSLQNNDPFNPPSIDPNYLSSPNDIKCTISAIRMAIDIISTKPFRDIGAIIHWPITNKCKHLWTEQIKDDYLECIIRTGALTGHHSAGTCTMAGLSPVVDEYLRVRGVRNLRIVDASVMPSPISSSTNSLIVVIAERAADFILNKK